MAMLALAAPFLRGFHDEPIRLGSSFLGGLILIAAGISLLSSVSLSLSARRARRAFLGGLGALAAGSFIGMLTVQLVSREDHREIIHLGGSLGIAPQLLVAAAIAMMFAGLIGVTRGMTPSK
ncbi:MAG: hypothetical protein Q4P33_06145 [Flaviflexus sp.]|nr:hypothetical protein [Flaviflexus sp.]